MSVKRRDNKNRILHNGESQRSDGRSYGTIHGIRGVVKPAFQEKPLQKNRKRRF